MISFSRRAVLHGVMYVCIGAPCFINKKQGYLITFGGEGVGGGGFGAGGRKNL